MYIELYIAFDVDRASGIFNMDVPEHYTEIAIVSKTGNSHNKSSSVIVTWCSTGAIISSEIELSNK